MRAAELQTAEREVGDDLTWDEVRQLGKEVGIPGRFLQQALLEEQNRSPEVIASGVVERVVGTATAEAERVIRGERAGIERTMMKWVEDEELLAIQRQRPGRIDWEPLPGLQVAFKRSSAALGGGRKPFMLAKAKQVTAIITELEPGYCHVRLQADLKTPRNEHLGFGALFLGGGAVGTAVLASTGALLVLMPIPVIAGAALASVIWRSYRPTLARTRLGLERALDHLERGTVKPGHELPSGQASLLQVVTNEVRKALGS